MYVCSCSMNQCSIVHSSTSWQRCETQVHFNDVVAPPAAEHGSGTDACMYVCMCVPDLWWCMIGVRFSVDTHLTNIMTEM